MFALGRARLVNALALPLVVLLHIAVTALGGALLGVDGVVGALFVVPTAFAVVLLVVGAGRECAGLARELARDGLRFVGRGGRLLTGRAPRSGSAVPGLGGVVLAVALGSALYAARDLAAGGAGRCGCWSAPCAPRRHERRRPGRAGRRGRPSPRAAECSPTPTRAPSPPCRCCSSCWRRSPGAAGACPRSTRAPSSPTADRIADGAVAYRDVRYFYGPVGVYTLAGAFELFGTSFTTVFAFGLVQAAAILAAFYALARSFLPALTACLAHGRAGHDRLLRARPTTSCCRTPTRRPSGSSSCS